MYAYVRDHIVLDIDTRDDITPYYHPDVADDYILCPDTVKIGDGYRDGKFIPQEVDENA